MITDEQIITILKTWKVHNATMVNQDLTLTLIDPTAQYLVEFRKHVWSLDNDISFQFELFEIKDILNDLHSLILAKEISSDIKLEVEYFVTNKAKDYIKGELNKIFS